ncbi:uncharacterized protein Gasu_16680 [Galdieria sulphuraria]|uniref:Uncharacterized protein n=1 Tax=Galdieria sulphuraria TaxID=130081 RepID=M2X418_GALSU|nr:uncharacterized protein Gasu_16680 [Galdieria sulphuraria]EME31175.1 hypothetical protein Gasu_16680 [Galdieria sulphuraria]|eukprot:XP_005707695.1 hypothetical protein Gasu_16680 [Galdieria sulphuraria]
MISLILLEFSPSGIPFHLGIYETFYQYEIGGLILAIVAHGFIISIIEEKSDDAFLFRTFLRKEHLISEEHEFMHLTWYIFRLGK